MRPLLPAAIVVALLLAGCSSPEKDPETGFPRVPPTATHFSLLKSEGGKARYYQADHTPGEPAIVFRADRVDEEHWHLMRFERDGEKTRPEESDLQRISLLLDAVIVFPIPEGEYPGAPHEHPLRAQFREIASGKKPAKWSALLPVILSDECPSPRARSRFVLILVKRADDPEKLCPVLRENLAKLELVSDDDWKAFGIEALATRKDGVALVGLAVAQACTFDDAKLAILRAVLDLKALTEPEQLELVKVASAVSSDQGKAEV
ncbi:hypothetical protein HY251_19285, partial [bacterium]|nr:hypothetical protein [bacterium]